MKTFARYVLAALLAGAAVLHGIPASAEDYDGDDYRESAPHPDDYYETLAPYGHWIDHAEYGRVWHPGVAAGWRPYYHGHWAWSPYGWTWISSEPWGWTFHYGRWSYAPVWGWVWVPGTVWGPAWVDWYWDDGYVGWAPLSPFRTHVTVVNHFVFVREHDFCAPRGRYIAHHRLPRRVHDRWRHRDWRDKGGSGKGFGRGFRPPDRERIERVSGRPVPRFDGKPPRSAAPRRARRDERVARPRQPDLGQARRGGWQRGGRDADEARPDQRPRAPRVDGPERRPRAPRFGGRELPQREQHFVGGGDRRPAGGMERGFGGGAGAAREPGAPGGGRHTGHAGRARGDGSGRGGDRGDSGGRRDGGGLGGLGRGFQPGAR